MLVFDPVKWGYREIDRLGGVVVAARTKLHRDMGCGGENKCPEECPNRHLCAWTRDVQIMCRKELDKRRKEGDSDV